jgi:ribosomal protein S18 acetylase RimI-like enzyme
MALTSGSHLRPRADHLAAVRRIGQSVRLGGRDDDTFRSVNFFGLDLFDAGTLREVSGICTHPDFLGRGLASRLTSKLIRRQMQRGETPFLHLMGDNPIAYRLYQKMGFRDYARQRCA